MGKTVILTVVTGFVFLYTKQKPPFRGSFCWWCVYFTKPAFFKTTYAPRFWMVRIAEVERVSTKVRLSSGTKMRFFCKLGCFLTFPVGLNFVARVRFEYPPATFPPFPVTSQTFDISRATLPQLHFYGKRQANFRIPLEAMG